MLDTLLHIGTTHPDLTWMIVSSILSFIIGLGLGSFSDRLRTLVRPESTARTD